MVYAINICTKRRILPLLHVFVSNKNFVYFVAVFFFCLDCIICSKVIGFVHLFQNFLVIECPNFSHYTFSCRSWVFLHESLTLHEQYAIIILSDVNHNRSKNPKSKFSLKISGFGSIISLKSCTLM